MSNQGLAPVRNLCARVARESWFAAVAEPLTLGEIDDAQCYLDGIGLSLDAPIQVTGVTGWDAASRLLQRPDWDRRWWEAEELLRTQLLQRAATSHGQSALIAALTEITVAANDIVHGAAAIAATRAGTADERLARVAAGAATQACYLGALATAAGATATGHPFQAKYRLFAAGRWPLTIADSYFYVF